MDKNILVEKIRRRSVAARNKDVMVILDLIEESQFDILDYTNLSEMPEGLKGALIELVIIKCNKLGNEGISSESYSGVSQTFIRDWPKDLKRKIRKFKKLSW
ncbi:phage head-tail connector protein [Clostridium sardiniense]|uniref:Phage head-tail connector protein n=1 Tax=Clostridium sardiniense TaxID=29369 RepID=A0ABS7KWS8_CLOSR|nr:phage head-tail connector protein [Clostridium sardiniense]MBY0755027.1 phage head-tail connector protein [Clostridium sardiniense]MDQ0459118.1 hypothetical protein [Clostridium sardiniense]